MSQEKSNLCAEKVAQLEGLKKLSKFFEIDLIIKVFGVSVVHFHWPPKS